MTTVSNLRLISTSNTVQIIQDISILFKKFLPAHLENYHYFIHFEQFSIISTNTQWIENIFYFKWYSKLDEGKYIFIGMGLILARFFSNLLILTGIRKLEGNRPSVEQYL